VIIKFIKKIDSVVFNGLMLRLKRSYSQKNDNTYLKKIFNQYDYSFSVYYQKNYNSLYSGLCDKYGSDKGEVDNTSNPYPWKSHTYSDYYSRIFDHCRGGVYKVFECGIGTNNTSIDSNMSSSGQPGASLRVWRDYFPNAEIFGADIDKDILFREDKIQTFYVDQTQSSSVVNMWNEINHDSFDLIIDDGLHTFDAGICFFENSIDQLSSDGIYIIEDVSKKDLKAFSVFFKDSEFQVDFVPLFRPMLKLGSNSLVVIRKKIS
jgi:hypothetical protein